MVRVSETPGKRRDLALENLDVGGAMAVLEGDPPEYLVVGTLNRGAEAGQATEHVGGAVGCVIGILGSTIKQRHEPTRTPR